MYVAFYLKVAIICGYILVGLVCGNGTGLTKSIVLFNATIVGRKLCVLGTNLQNLILIISTSKTYSP